MTSPARFAFKFAATAAASSSMAAVKSASRVMLPTYSLS